MASLLDGLRLLLRTNTHSHTQSHSIVFVCVCATQHNTQSYLLIEIRLGYAYFFSSFLPMLLCKHTTRQGESDQRAAQSMSNVEVERERWIASDDECFLSYVCKVGELCMRSLCFCLYVTHKSVEVCVVRFVQASWVTSGSGPATTTQHRRTFSLNTTKKQQLYYLSFFYFTQAFPSSVDEMSSWLGIQRRNTFFSHFG